MNRTAELSSGIGKGLPPVSPGTAAMTVLEHASRRGLRKRAPSTAPARATAKLLGINEVRRRARGGPLERPLALGLRHRVGHRARVARRRRGWPPPTAAHGAAIYGRGAGHAAGARDRAARSIFWPKQEIAIDAFHHAVYATATGVAYEALASGRTRTAAAA